MSTDEERAQVAASTILALDSITRGQLQELRELRKFAEDCRVALGLPEDVDLHEVLDAVERLAEVRGV